MYLDPGSTSLFVQAVFAVIATAIATIGRSRDWVIGVLARVSEGMRKLRRRPGV